MTLVNIADEIDLFAGTAGQFGGIEAFEQTLDVRGGAGAVLAAAATQETARQVIVAARFGKGLVIRTGLPEFSARRARERRARRAAGPHLDAAAHADDRRRDNPRATLAQTAGVVVAALLAAVVLLVGSPRARAAAMLGALVLTPVLLVANIWSTPQFEPLRERPRLALAAGVGGLVVLALGALRSTAGPSCSRSAAAAALPFRVPIESGGDTANLLVPLYLVIAAGVLAYALPRLRAPRGLEEMERGDEREVPPRARRCWSGCWRRDRALRRAGDVLRATSTARWRRRSSSTSRSRCSTRCSCGSAGRRSSPGAA